MRSKPFVPDKFEVPERERTDLFVIEPLQKRHNKSDFEAWTSSREHIRAAPGFIGDKLREIGQPRGHPVARRGACTHD